MGWKTVGAKAFSQTYITSLTFLDSVTGGRGLCPENCPDLEEATICWHHQPGDPLSPLPACLYFRRFWKYQLPGGGQRPVQHGWNCPDVPSCRRQTELVSTRGLYHPGKRHQGGGVRAFAYLSNLGRSFASPEAKLEEIGAYAFASTPIPSLVTPDSGRPSEATRSPAAKAHNPGSQPG